MNATRREVESQLEPLRGHPVVRALEQLPAELDTLLVGGVIRDSILGRAPLDIDAVVAARGAEAAEQLAALLGARAFRLGGERFAAYRLETDQHRVDFWDRSPMSLEADLQRRDFTINSIAIRVRSWELIDPFGGIRDLMKGHLEATSPESFEDDPLRVVRLARFRAELPNFSIDAETLRLARAAAPGLSGVAIERVRTELKALFSAERPDQGLEVLASAGLFPSLWGTAIADSPVALGRELERLVQCADHFGTWLVESPEAKRGFEAPIDIFIATQALLLRSAPSSLDAVRALHEGGLLSGRDRSAIEHLLNSKGWPPDDPARRWFLYELGALWPTAVAFLGARSEPALWEKESRALLELARQQGSTIFHPPALLDGREVAATLSLEPGPALGAAVRALRRQQIEGRVRTASEAVEWLRRHARSG